MEGLPVDESQSDSDLECDLQCQAGFHLLRDSTMASFSLLKSLLDTKNSPQYDRMSPGLQQEVNVANSIEEMVPFLKEDQCAHFVGIGDELEEEYADIYIR